MQIASQVPSFQTHFSFILQGFIWGWQGSTWKKKIVIQKTCTLNQNTNEAMDDSTLILSLANGCAIIGSSPLANFILLAGVDTRITGI